MTEQICALAVVSDQIQVAQFGEIALFRLGDVLGAQLANAVATAKQDASLASLGQSNLIR